MERLYTVKQVASLLQVHELTVRRWIQSNKLEATKLNNHYRVTEENLNKFIKKGEK